MLCKGSYVSGSGNEVIYLNMLFPSFSYSSGNEFWKEHKMFFLDVYMTLQIDFHE